MYVRALSGKEKALGPDHTSTLNTVYNLGNLYRNQGRLAEAEQMYGRALAEEKALGPDRSRGKEKALGKEYPDTLTSVNDLALVLQKQRKYE
jgi:tetratricopeptide (TPR) repeat protein